MPLPVLEKILRPVVVYLFLIIFLRLFGKRELAQLNPFDLVVLLSLSNTVQNAIIGNDNSVTGGIIGAFSLLAINWVLARLLFKLPKVNEALEGTKTVLISHGMVDLKALKKETLTELELRVCAAQAGASMTISEVETCVLEPNGTFLCGGDEAVAGRGAHCGAEGCGRIADARGAGDARAAGGAVGCGCLEDAMGPTIEVYNP